MAPARCGAEGRVVFGFEPGASSNIRRISRCTRVRLTRRPARRSCAVMRREP
jgi:hypothetical protein